MSPAKTAWSRRCFLAAVAGGVAAAVAGVIAVSSRSPEGRDSSSFLDYINSRGTIHYPNHFDCGVFLGTGWSDAKVASQLEQWEAEGRWYNPFTGKPFDPSRDRIFAFGAGNVPADLPRVLTDHFGVRLLSSFGQITGHSFDYIICHSNGCTVAFQALKSGAIRARYVFALGADTKADDLVGTLEGTKVIYFEVRGDPIPKLSAIKLWAEKTVPGLQVRLPFGPGGSDTILLKRPVNFRSGSPHSLIDAYLPSVRQFVNEGGLRRQFGEIAKFLDQTEEAKDRQQQPAPEEGRQEARVREERRKDAREPKASTPPPGCPPFCPPKCPPDCPPGNRAGSGEPPSTPPSVSSLAAPTGSGPGAPGGISARIAVNQKDFDRARKQQGQ